MEALRQDVEAQCTTVQRTAAASARVVDRLRHGLSVISDRSKRIKSEVADWEEAVDRVEATADELEDAASAYTLPRYVEAVARGDTRDVAMMVRALVHLVEAKAYLEGRPSNTVGERLQRRVGSQLQKVLKTTEDRVTSTVIASARTHVVPVSEMADSIASPRSAGRRQGRRDSQRSRLLRDGWKRQLGALHQLVEQHAVLFERFNAAEEVVTSLSERVVRHLEDLLSIDYRRRYEGFDDDNGGGFGASARRGRGGVRTAMTFLKGKTMFDDEGARHAVMSTYQPGDHPLPAHSRDVRALVEEACEVVSLVILRAFPTSEDDQRYHDQLALEHGPAMRSEAFTLPSELVRAVAGEVFEHAHRAIAHVARSPSVSIHDAIFASLDIVSELWQWRRLARRTPGLPDESGLVAEIDACVETELEAANQLLTDFGLARGMLDREELLKSTATDDYLESHRLKLSPAILQLIGVHSREIGAGDEDGYGSSGEDASDDYGLSDSDNDRDDDDDDEWSRPGSSDSGHGGGRRLRFGSNRRRASKARSDAKRRGYPLIPRSIRMRWLPSMDGAVHPSTTSLIRFMRHLLGTYAGVSCLAMAGSCDAADEIVTMQKQARRRAGGDARANGDAPWWAEALEDYLNTCVSGHLSDLEVIADAAALCLNDSEKPIDDPFAPFNRPLFIANNMFFAARAMVDDAPFSSTERNRKACDPLIEMYEDRLATALDNYGALWADALPEFYDERSLESAIISPASEELTKAERAAVKLWYEKASKALKKMTHVSRAHVVAQSILREQLSDAAADAVADAFARFDERVVKGRYWSSRPERHLSAPVDELVAQVRGIFGASAPTASTSTRRSASTTVRRPPEEL